MKFNLCLIMALASSAISAQSLQVQYDLRHSVDPKRNAQNFPALYFEYFKTLDSGKAFIKPGSFLFKMEAHFAGEKSNIGKFYMQVSQSFRCWKPKIFLNLQYSGGLGVTTPRQYSYYITNTYSLGISYPFKWQDAYMTAVLNYKYVPYAKPSHDFLYTLYWWKGLFAYKGEFSGDFSLWTENKNHGDDLTKDMKGKRFSFLGEPQFWYKLSKVLAAGIRVNIFYHVNFTSEILEVYPAIGVRCKF